MIEQETRSPRYEPTVEDRIWRFRRLCYYFAHLLLFALIVYRMGPNLFLFHSPFSPSPDYYARLTRPYVPMIAAIKAYQRDCNSLPEDSMNLPKEYQPDQYDGGVGTILGEPTITFEVDGGRSVLAYDFTPATEGWLIYAPRYQGPIPAPIVPAAPSPATRKPHDDN